MELAEGIESFLDVAAGYLLEDPAEDYVHVRSIQPMISASTKEWINRNRGFQEIRPIAA